MTKKVWALAIHGGASPAYRDDYDDALESMRDVLHNGRAALVAGASALDVVTDVVQAMEESGLHVAGRGASPNAEGKYELDAAIMDGSNRKASSVGVLRGFRSPIRCAYTLLTETRHVFLVGKGAVKVLKKFDLDRVKNPSRYYRPVVPGEPENQAFQQGSVGAVALDSDGRLASATSTGGLVTKHSGHIGDTSMIGAGTWADERVAVSCTGQGQYFMRSAAAADLSARIKYTRTDLQTAAACVLEDISILGGQGGMIAIDRLGRVAMPFNTRIMKRGFASFKGEFEVKV